MLTEIPIYIGSFIVISFLYIAFFWWKTSIYEKKYWQVVGAFVALGVEALAIWRGIIYMPSNPGSSTSADSSSVFLFAIWLLVAVAGGICVLFYLKAFSNLIAPWSKHSKTA